MPSLLRATVAATVTAEVLARSDLPYTSERAINSTNQTSALGAFVWNRQPSWMYYGRGVFIAIVASEDERRKWCHVSKPGRRMGGVKREREEGEGGGGRCVLMNGLHLQSQ